MDIEALTLTTNHSASSYGLPVLLVDGAPYGPGDLVDGIRAADLVRAFADAFCGPLHENSAWRRVRCQCGYELIQEPDPGRKAETWECYRWYDARTGRRADRCPECGAATSRLTTRPT